MPRRKKRRKNKYFFSQVIRNFTKNGFSDVQFIYLLAGLIAVVAFGLFLWLGIQYLTNKPRFDVLVNPFVSSDVPEEDCEERHMLNGRCVEKVTMPQVVMLMIENHPEARPQSGLADARIVYEAPVEANYTRFMAVYDAEDEVEQIGPVRSARPYFLDWAAEYGEPMYMHVGGSPEALEKIKTTGLFNLNEFYRGWYYWRADFRLAPHNVYTSSENWDAALKKYSDGDAGEMAAWQFGAMDVCEDDCVTEITASFLPPTYQAVWKFNSTTQKYERYQDGKLHRDLDGRKIVADTVIVQHVETEVIDDIGRKRLDTVGTGVAQVFRNGHMISGSWKKGSRLARTVWLDETGGYIPLAAGKIWIEVLPQDGTLMTE